MEPRHISRQESNYRPLKWSSGHSNRSQRRSEERAAALWGSHEGFVFSWEFSERKDTLGLFWAARAALEIRRYTSPNKTISARTRAIFSSRLSAAQEGKWGDCAEYWLSSWMKHVSLRFIYQLRKYLIWRETNQQPSHCSHVLMQQNPRARNQFYSVVVRFSHRSAIVYYECSSSLFIINSLLCSQHIY